MVMDGSKEQTQGRFRKKNKLANIHVKQTEPYSPWQCDAKIQFVSSREALGARWSGELERLSLCGQIVLTFRPMCC